MIKVVLVDEFSVVRKGAASILLQAADIRIVGEAGDGITASAVIEKHQPDVLVSGIAMPGMNGIDLTRQCRRRSESTRVLIMSGHSEERTVLAALSAGAAGYFLKQCDIEDLIRAVRSVAAGHRYLSPPLNERALEEYAALAGIRPADPYESLSAREQEVLHLAAVGETNAAIGERLFISPRTAEHHRASALRKLGIRSHTELVLYALRRGILGVEGERSDPLDADGSSARDNGLTRGVSSSPVTLEAGPAAVVPASPLPDGSLPARENPAPRRRPLVAQDTETVIASLDLDAYLKRIGWVGELRPDYPTLERLLRAHMLSIPFENLDILLRRPIRLDLDSLQNKLVRDGRGGYCFEHAVLFAAALEKIGFEPVLNSARVTLFIPHTAAPRTHVLISVELPEGRFVMDPSLGSLAPTTPVPVLEETLDPAEQRTHWVIRDDGQWILRAKSNDRIVEAWISTLEPESMLEFELGNHFTSTHPSSAFVNRVMMQSLKPEGRVSVMNRDVMIQSDGASRTIQLEDRKALRALIAEQFGFDLPEIEKMRIPTIPEWS